MVKTNLKFCGSYSVWGCPVAPPFMLADSNIGVFLYTDVY